jgi:hypothetical protein
MVPTNVMTIVWPPVGTGLARVGDSQGSAQSLAADLQAKRGFASDSLLTTMEEKDVSAQVHRGSGGLPSVEPVRGHQ